VRIAAYNARKEAARREEPKVDEYLQVRDRLYGAGSRMTRLICCHTALLYDLLRPQGSEST